MRQVSAIMAATQVLDTIPVELKVYIIVIHAVLLLAILALIYVRKKYRKDETEKTSGPRKAKTVAVENKEITIESCEWVNSTLGWLYSNSTKSSKALEIWISSLNDELRRISQENERIFIEGLIPGNQPPCVPSVYCLHVDGKMQCITFHLEAQEFSFLVYVEHPDGNATLLVSVIKLKGELTVQADKNDTEIDISARFIGQPEIVLNTKLKEGEDGVNAAAVEEKIKEVITKTVTSVPLPEADMSSPTSKDDISAIPQSITCLGEDGKILVKVIKGTDLSSCDGEVKEPYCVISCTDPPQKKRTTKKNEANNPFWNEYFILNVNKSTKEIVFDLFDHQKPPRDSDFHFNDNEEQMETDDFLGQVVVPLAAINRDQTCRLIFPVLPKSQKSNYVTGQLTIEFTFDKDGKVIDGAIPLISPSRTKIVEDMITTTTTTETITESNPDGTFTETTTTKTVTVNGDDADNISQVSDTVEEDNTVLETELVALEASLHDHDKDSDDEEQRLEEALSNPLDNVETQMELEILEAIVQQQDMDEDETKKNHKDERDSSTDVVTIKHETTEKTIIITEPVVITEEPKEEEKEKESEEEIPPTVVVPLAESPSKEKLQKEEEIEKTEETEHEETKEELGETPKTKSKKTRKVFTFKKHKHAKHEHEEDKNDGEEGVEKTEEIENKEEVPVEPSPKPKKMKKHWSFRSKKNKEAENEDEVKKDELAEEEAPKEEPEEEEKEVHPEESKEDIEEKDETEEKHEESEQKPKKGKKHWGFHSKKGKHPAEKEAKEDEESKDTVEEKTEEEKKDEDVVEPKEETEEMEEEVKPKKGKKHWKIARKGKGHEEKEPEEPKEELKAEEVKEEEEKEKNEEEEKKEDEYEENAEPEPKPEKTKKVKKAWTFHGRKHKEKKEEHNEEDEQLPPTIVTNGDATDENNDENKENQSEEQSQVPSISQASTPEPVKPRKTRSFHFRNRQRPVSMIETSENKPGMSRDTSKRHSFHEGDKPPKSGSKDKLSILSVSSTQSTLVIETSKHEYYHIPPAMAKRGTYEQKGTKLHIYKDHVFSATHFSGNMPNCAVCDSQLGGTLLAVGKQGYECRDCKVAVHKKCHFLISSECPSSSIRKMEIIVEGQEKEHKSA